MSAKFEPEARSSPFAGVGDDRSLGPEQRLAEAEQTKQRLLAELAETGNKLTAANAELRRANLDRDQFAFSASHALREPLRNLAIYSELLRRNTNAALDEQARDYLAIVLENAKRMEVLFRDLLAFLEIKDSAAFGESDANVVLKHVIADLDDSIHETGATLNATQLPVLCLAYTHLYRLLRNLLDNSIKYAAAGVRPHIQIDSYVAGDDAVVCVRDNGLGIAAEHQDRIFELFKRLHGSERYEGTGLGLAICRKIVEQNGGHIWVESQPGKGAVFCFQLRRAEAKKARVARSG